MTHNIIEALVLANFPNVLRHEIVICDINKQLESVNIIFQPDKEANISKLGNFMEALIQYTITDRYGDLTSAKIEFTTFHEEPDSDDMYVALYIKTNIDS